MRSTLAVVSAALVVTTTTAAAQTGGDSPPPSVNDLKAPNTAAVTLLGTSPTSIERPDSPKAFVVNVISQLAKDDGLPQNYAVQLAPYWMRWHPRLTFDSYANPTVLQQIARSFAVSLATADWTSGEGRSEQDLGSRAALGLSTVPLQGALDPEVDRLRARLTKTLTDLLRALKNIESGPRIEALRAHRKALAAALDKETDPARIVQRSRELDDADAALKAIVAESEAEIARLQEQSRRLAASINTLDTDRYGPRLAVAAAWSWGVPEDVLQDARRDRMAVWVTPSYRLRLGPRSDGQEDEEEEAAAVTGLEPGALEVIGVARFLNDRADGSANAWDVGARVVWQIRREVALSTEVVRRTWDGDERTDSLRAAGLFEARIGDNAYFFAAFGRDYDEPETRSTLLSTVGLNFGFGRKPLLTF